MSKRKFSARENENKENSSGASSDSDNEISAYEQQRLKNIEEKNRLLRNLGIDQAVEELNSVVPKPKSKPTPQKKKSTNNFKKKIYYVPKREPSRRLRNLTPDGNEFVKAEPEDLLQEKEEKDERLLDSLPMALEDQESMDFLNIWNDIKQEVVYDPLVNLKECSIERFRDTLMCLRMDHEPQKVVTTRIQSLLVHPTLSKQLVIVGSCSGNLGLWDKEAACTFEFHPHQAAVNCISVCPNDHAKIYTTSFDGTFVCADLESTLFSNVFATDFNERVRHLTWHDQLDDKTFLLCHGDGKIGVLDLRNSKKIGMWIPCFERSARTVQHHPTAESYFLAASGAGSACNIYDIRQCSAHKAIPVIEMIHPKALTSAFFSPSGDQVLSTCNDDQLRIYSVSSFIDATVKIKIAHNNHTGRWLSVFKAKWHPSRNDAFLIGSLLHPRRIQIYSTNGKLLSELRSDDMSTVSPVLSAHAVLPIIAGGNSSGRIHVFTVPEN